jgi:TRAP-type C4-dicarboxylate transport system substrate-binding protein
VWRWQGDEVSRMMFEKIGLRGVPLGVPDVLPSLMSGRIDACFGSPLAAMALQWTSRIRYMTDEPSTYGIGATVVRKDVWEKLSEGDRKKVKKISRMVSKKLRKRVRSDDKAAYRATIRKGVKIMKTPAELSEKLDVLAEKAWDELAGKLYSKAELEMVLKYRNEYRAKHSM